MALFTSAADHQPTEYPKELPQRKSAEAISDAEREGMQQITRAFPIPKKLPRLQSKDWAKYGGVGKQPRRWRDVTDRHRTAAQSYNWSLFVQLAAVYRNEKIPADKTKAKNLFLVQARVMTTRNASDSGSTYNVAKLGIQDTILMMSNVLKAAGLYNDVTRAWMMEDRFMLKEDPGENMDWTRDRVTMSWALVANMDNGPEKLHRLRLLQRATNISLAKLITPDGGAIHHNCDHSSYAAYSLPKIVDLVARIHSTPFRLNDDVVARLKAYGRAHSLASIDLHMPGNLGARASLAPIHKKTLPNLLLSLHQIAQVDDPNDTEMIGLFLGLKGRHESWKKSWRQRGLKPVDVRGHHSYNISSAAIHRRPSWVAVINGTREPFKGIEMYTPPGSPRSFMRNSAFGSLQILLSDVKDPHQGYAKNGWDHNHYAGVTAPVLPMNMLMTSRETEQIRNKAQFGGGTSLGENGIWGMINRPGSMEVCRQSAFCFENRITFLTSNVKSIAPSPKQRKNQGESHPIHTTLFQFSLKGTDQPVYVNDVAKSKFPYNATWPLDAPVRLLDNHSNGYYVHPQKGTSLHLTRSTQYSFDFSKLKPQADPTVIKGLRKNLSRPDARQKLLDHCQPIPGDFSVAYIDHHTQSKTQASAAAFTVFIQDKPPQSDQLPYRILRQDRIAHVLYDKPSETFGYIAFDAEQDLGAGPLIKVNRPAAVMIASPKKDYLSCSVSSTDAKHDGLFQGKGPPGALPPIILTIQGNWSIAATKRRDMVTKRKDGNTIISIPYLDSRPVLFSLQTSL